MNVWLRRAGWVTVIIIIGVSLLIESDTPTMKQVNELDERVTETESRLNAAEKRIDALEDRLYQSSSDP